MNPRTLRAGFVLCMAMFVAMAPGLAASRSYPSQPVMFIVPFAPGGGAEKTARLIGARLAQALGQPVVVETRPGAGSAIGTAMVAGAKPDGYTLLFQTNASDILPHMQGQKLGWDPRSSFEPVSLLATYPLVIATRASLPVRSLPELVEYAKSHPGKLTYASSGSGGPTHLGAEMFKKQFGIDLLHVPYKGNAPATMALLAGDVDMTFDSLVGPLPHIRAGKLTALAVTGTERAPQLPQVATVAQSGLARFSYEAWNGVSVPAGTPKEVIARLHAEIQRILGMPEVREALVELGYRPVSGTPADFAHLIAEDYRRYGDVMRTLNLRAGE